MITKAADLASLNAAFVEITRCMILTAQNALSTGTEAETIDRWTFAGLITNSENENTNWGGAVVGCMGTAFDINNQMTGRDILSKWADLAAKKVAHFDQTMGTPNDHT